MKIKYKKKILISLGGLTLAVSPMITILSRANRNNFGELMNINNNLIVPKLTFTNEGIDGFNREVGAKSSIFKVDDFTLLVGTHDSGFYKVDLPKNSNKTKWVWTPQKVDNFQHDVGTLSSIARINSTTLLVGTGNNGFFINDHTKGFYKVDILSSTWKWTKVNISSTKLDDKSSYWSSITKIKDNMFIIGTADQGFYKLDTSSLIWKWTEENSLKLTSFSGRGSTTTQISENKFLVGTGIDWDNQKNTQRPFFELDTSSSIWKWSSLTTNNAPLITNGPGVAARSIKVDDKTMLVGTHESGFYKLDISTPIWKWNHLKIDQFNYLSAYYNSMMKIDKNALFVASRDKGFYEVDTTSTNWRWIKLDTKKVNLSEKSGQDSSLIKINNNLLIGGTFDGGFYKIEIN